MRKEKSIECQRRPALLVMAIRMKPLIISLLLVMSVAMRIPLSLADPYTDIVSQHCGNSNGRGYSNGSAFQRNLNEVLETLVKNAYHSRFKTCSVGDEGFSSPVYGLVQCTENLDPHDCQQCASAAKTTLVHGGRGTSGGVLLNGCILRYSDHKFYSNSRESRKDFTIPIWYYCANNKYRNGGAFTQNLEKSLKSLAGNVNPSGFNSMGYGLVQCRGDLGSSACKHCAATAKANLVDRCQNTSGLIQLEGCLLSYDNHDFYNHIETKQSTPPRFTLCNDGNKIQPQQFSKTLEVLLSNITTRAVQNPTLFAADSVVAPSNLTENIYGLAQCRRDLSPSRGRSCLTYALEDTTSCPSGALGGLSGSGNLTNEVFEFFNTSILSGRPQGESPRLPERRNGSNLSLVPPRLPGMGPQACEGKFLEITLGVIAAVLGLTTTIALWMWYSSRLKRGDRISETKEVMLSSTIINSELILKYDILKEATSNFKIENKLGEGGFGAVFKGVLPNGREVAVKRLNLGSRQGDAEFLNEANLISRVQHRNIVKLLGCCVESSERLLVYEYLPISSLDKLLFDSTKRHLLDWKDRYKIIVGTARGLAYLHEESDIRIIHRDIKASNILLDYKHRPKIADFGLARLFAEDRSHVSTRVAGTLGYMAPEYALRGQLTEKADVFSFGVLLLEIISGRKNQSSAADMEFLIEGTWRLYKSERGLEVIDPTLEGSYSSEEAIRLIKIGLLCTQSASSLRPTMSRVVWMLTSERENLPSPTKPAFIDLDNDGTANKLKRPRVIDPDKTSSSNWSFDAATSSTATSYIHSSAADPSSSILEPR